MGGKIFSSILSIALLLGCLISLPVVWLVIKRGIKMQDGQVRETFNEKCGSLIEELRADSNSIAAYWNFLTLIRWLITTIILILMKGHNEF